MRISNLAVDNRVAVYILIAIIVVIGWASYTGLPREASPDITIPLVIVSRSGPAGGRFTWDSTAPQNLGECRVLPAVRKSGHRADAGVFTVRT